MWTLFFAGNDFAPETKVDGEPVQGWLQRHYCDMLSKVAEAVKEEPNVLGFDILNEPSVGFIGTKDATDISPNVYLIGWRVDVWSSILLGAGFSRIVDFFSSFMFYKGKRTLNTNNVCAWRGGMKIAYGERMACGQWMQMARQSFFEKTTLLEIQPLASPLISRKIMQSRFGSDAPRLSESISMTPLFLLSRCWI